MPPLTWWIHISHGCKAFLGGAVCCTRRASHHSGEAPSVCSWSYVTLMFPSKPISTVQLHPRDQRTLNHTLAFYPESPPSPSQRKSACLPRGLTKNQCSSTLDAKRLQTTSIQLPFSPFSLLWTGNLLHPSVVELSFKGLCLISVSEALSLIFPLFCCFFFSLTQEVLVLSWRMSCSQLVRSWQQRYCIPASGGIVIVWNSKVKSHI